MSTSNFLIWVILTYTPCNHGRVPPPPVLLMYRMALRGLISNWSSSVKLLTIADIHASESTKDVIETASTIAGTSFAGQIRHAKGLGLWYSGTGTYHTTPADPEDPHGLPFCGLILGVCLLLLGKSATFLCHFPCKFAQSLLPSTGSLVGQSVYNNPPTQQQWHWTGTSLV